MRVQQNCQVVVGYKKSPIAAKGVISEPQNYRRDFEQKYFHGSKLYIKIVILMKKFKVAFIWLIFLFENGVFISGKPDNPTKKNF